MEVGRCQCSKTYSWQIHAAQGNHDFQTANSEQAFSAKMKPIEKMKKKSCRVSKYLRKAYWNASTNCLWRFEYCLHKTLIIVSLIFSYDIWEGRTEIKVSHEISHRSINLSHIIQAQWWLRTWKYCDNSVRNTKNKSSKIWQDIQCMKSRCNSL